MMRQVQGVENIIMVSKDGVFLEKEDRALEVTLSDKLDFYDIVKMNIEVKQDTSLRICYKKSKEIKLDVSIIVNPNVTFHMQEIKEAKNTKIQTKYCIYEQANVFVQKFYDASFVKELDLFYLNGVGASIHSTMRGIIKGKSELDMMVYHNYPTTESDIENKLVTIEKGCVRLHVATLIYNKMRSCKANQSNFILKENRENSTIKPILLIEENDVEASHSGHISSVDAETLYYMYTRGIKEHEAKKLYIKGFLKGDFYNIDEIMKKYWR